MRKKSVNTENNRFLPLAFLLLLIIVWETAVWVFSIRQTLLPSPFMIGKSLVNNAPLLLMHTGSTLVSALAGFLLAIIPGIVMAVLINKFALLKATLYPLLTIAQAVPAIILALLLLIWFGLGLLPKTLLVALVCFFPVAVKMVEGLKNINHEQVEILQVMGASPNMVFCSVQLPAVLPYLFAGLKISATYCVMGAVISEWLGAKAGLGVYMITSFRVFETADLFAAILIAVLLSLFLFKATELMAWLIMPWSRQNKAQLL